MLEADLNEDYIVNFEDFAMFAGQWQTGEAEQYVQIAFVYDANIGLAEFGASGYSPDAQRIFLLMDGQYAGEIFGFREGWPLGVDVSELSGGEHLIKAVSVDSNGIVSCSNVTAAEFACPLNYCIMPNEYEPNKPLYFSAFNPTGGDVTVNAYSDMNVVWSQTYSGDGFFGSIPPEITNQYDFDYINFAPSDGAAISKTSDPETSNSENVQALIIVPNLILRLKASGTIQIVQTAFENMGIKYIKLTGFDACYGFINAYAKTSFIKYIYILAHGNYKIGGVLRTVVDLNGPVVSMKKSDPLAPSWCGSLGKYWEPRAKSFASMGFTTLEYAQFDTCYSGRLMINFYDQLVEGQPGDLGRAYDAPISDMSIALGMHRDSFASRAYHGWYDKNYVRWFPNTDYESWTGCLWGALGNEDNLQVAIDYALSKQTDFSPGSPAKNYRLKKEGSPSEIFLRNDY
jgi:hypothetical protein